MFCTVCSRNCNHVFILKSCLHVLLLNLTLFKGLYGHQWLPCYAHLATRSCLRKTWLTVYSCNTLPPWPTKSPVWNPPYLWAIWKPCLPHSQIWPLEPHLTGRQLVVLLISSLGLIPSLLLPELRVNFYENGISLHILSLLVITFFCCSRKASWPQTTLGQRVYFGLQLQRESPYCWGRHGCRLSEQEPERSQQLQVRMKPRGNWSRVRL